MKSPADIVTLNVPAFFPEVVLLVLNISAFTESDEPRLPEVMLKPACSAVYTLALSSTPFSSTFTEVTASSQPSGTASIDKLTFSTPVSVMLEPLLITGGAKQSFIWFIIFI